MKPAVCILSGGIDSATAAYQAKQDCADQPPICITFDYSQRHGREITAAEEIAGVLGSPWHLIGIQGMKCLLPGSSITDDHIDTPVGHYQADNMRQTVVPGRNAMFLATAWGIAAAHGASALYTGVHAGDHHIYPDCRPDFIHALSRALNLGTRGIADDLKIKAPFVQVNKAVIVATAQSLGVPLELTYTCYEGGEQHCGRCGACQERREAFELAGVADPTNWADA